MLFYMIVLFMIVILRIFLKSKKKYCLIIGSILFFILAFRNPVLGNSDTVSLYIPSFYKVMNMTFAEISYYFRNSDTTFYQVTKLFTLFSSNLNLYFAFCALPLCFFTSRLIYKYSNNPVLSFIMFYSLNFYSWSFIIIRHSIALGIIIFSYDFIKNDKLIKFIITVLVASLFHGSSIVFLLAYPIAKKIRITSNNVYIFLPILLFSILLFGNEFLGFIFQILNNVSHYASYQYRESVMGPGMFIIYFFVLLISNIFSNNMIGKERENNSIVFVGVVLCTLSIFLAEFFRLSMFFSIFSIILLPNAINKIKGKQEKIIINLFLIIIFGIYSILSFDNLNLIPYKSIIFGG